MLHNTKQVLMSQCYQSESIFKLPDTKWILLLSENS